MVDIKIDHEVLARKAAGFHASLKFSGRIHRITLPAVTERCCEDRIKFVIELQGRMRLLVVISGAPYFSVGVWLY